jgi:hypothetical protein
MSKKKLPVTDENWSWGGKDKEVSPNSRAILPRRDSVDGVS